MNGIARQAGFTLVEMLISMAIFAVITAFATANFNAGRQGDELRFASQIVASDVRRAQVSATGGETVRFCRDGARHLLTCPDGLDASCGIGTCVNEVPSGYGVHFSSRADGEPRIAHVFADADGDGRWRPGEEYRSGNVSPGAFVSVVGLAIDGVPVDDLDIVFQPPKPVIYFNDDIAGAIATITVSHSATGATKEVRVNRISGQVSAD